MEAWFNDVAENTERNAAKARRAQQVKKFIEDAKLEQGGQTNA